ncbi:MAG: enoyl-CoA hydratase/isomerase family protein [Dehalococcoidia bacterium]|nr:enoyl-CoA hydratase/isomerase family protein [Dehalococcoidia bacterium]
MPETVLVERDADIAGLTTITLNRPDKLNALNGHLHADLQSVCRELEDDHETRVVILTGAGRAFSAGADLGTSRTGTVPLRRGIVDPLEERKAAGTGNRTCELLEGLDQVTIGAVNGLAIGGAVAILASVDFRIGAQSAWFSIPEVDLDIPLTWNALPRLVRELGPSRTKELVMFCDRFSAQDAERWGFLNRVVPDEDVMATARAYAQRLIAKDPFSVASTKTTVNALAELMVPSKGTHADRELLMLARHVRREQQGRGANVPSVVPR